MQYFLIIYVIEFDKFVAIIYNISTWGLSALIAKKRVRRFRIICFRE